MASTNSLFREFCDTITLSDSKKAEIRCSRDAVRDDVRKWLSDKGKGSSSYYEQGSFAMNTMINPINGDDFDIDYGVYLDAYKDTDRSSWPAESTVHSWIVDAVEDRTKAGCTDKNACVRINYAHGYHIDMPIYIEKAGDAYLAHKTQGWIHSDAKELRDWFTDRCKQNDNQLRRIVRYLKRWKDYCDVDLKGIEITILAARNMNAAAGRDDDALRYTVESMLRALKLDFVCYKPVAPYENMFDGISASRERAIISALEKMLAALQSAHDAESVKTASEKLREVFGCDFPLGDDPKDRYAAAVVTSAPGVLKRDGRSG